VGEIKLLPLSDVRTDGGTQPRAEIDEGVVAEYAEAIAGKQPMPPVVVFFDGTHYWLADGFHRHLAHKKAGEPGIRADVRAGTQRDAVLFSCGANHDHGLRRTPADKRRAVHTLLQDEEWGQRSDRWIADAARVGHHLVAKVRESIGGAPNAPGGESIGNVAGSTGRAPSSTGNVTGSTIGRDGKKRKRPARRKPRAPKPNGQVITQEESEQVIDDWKDVPVGTVVTAKGEGAEDPTLDGIGLEVPEHLAETFAARYLVGQTRQQAGKLAALIDRYAKHPGGVYYRRTLRRTEKRAKDGQMRERYVNTDLKGLVAAAAQNVPFVSACHLCKGEINPACPNCDGLGWLSYFRWSLVPESEQKELEKLTNEAP
jgi:hypothetical protein